MSERVFRSTAGVVVLGLTLATTLASRLAAADLPDTPQGRAVRAYVEAFNSGDEKTFVAMHDKLMAPAALGRLTPERRGEMFHRLQGDFGKLTIEKVVSASAASIKILVPLVDGHRGVFSFDFEEQAPFRIAGVGIDVH